MNEFVFRWRNIWLFILTFDCFDFSWDGNNVRQNCKKLWPYWLYFDYILPKKIWSHYNQKQNNCIHRKQKTMKFQKSNKWVLPFCRLFYGSCASRFEVLEMSTILQATNIWSFFIPKNKLLLTIVIKSRVN